MCEDLDEPKQKGEEVGLRQPDLPNGISISEIPLLTDIVEFEEEEESK
jgi:hypothetical protein